MSRAEDNEFLAQQFAHYLEEIPTERVRQFVKEKVSISPKFSILNQIKEGVTEANIKKLWTMCMQQWFLSRAFSAVKIEKEKPITRAAQLQRRLTAKLKETKEFKAVKVLKLFNEPLVFGLTYTNKTSTTWRSFLLDKHEMILIAYYLPQQQLILYAPFRDPEEELVKSRGMKGKETSEYLKIKEKADRLFEGTFSHVKKIRFDALMIRTLSELAILRRLFVATPQEIVGTAYLDGIEISGDDVLAGLRGLRLRQELTINLHEVGPWAEAETTDLKIISTIGVQLKRLTAVDMLGKLIDTWIDKTSVTVTGPVVFN